MSKSIVLNSNLNSPARATSKLEGGLSVLNSSIDMDMPQKFFETSDSNIGFPVVNSRYEPEKKSFISQYNVKKTYTSKM